MDICSHFSLINKYLVIWLVYFNTLKLMIGLNVKPKTTKVLDEYMEENLCDFELGKNVLDRTIKHYS